MRSATRLRFIALVAAVGLVPIVGASPVAAAGIVVNSKTMLVQDDGTCTLPEAITAANTNTASGVSSGECAAGTGPSEDTITFSVSGTIYTTRLPDVSSAVVIDGQGKVVLNARQSNAFFIVSGGPVSLTRITFTNGRAQYGGAMIVAGTGDLRLDRTTISGSVAQQAGGINVGNNGKLIVVDSTISGNTASGAGGGIFGGTSSTVQVFKSTISGNKAGSGAGVFASGLASVMIANSTIAKNTATSMGGGAYLQNAAVATVYNSTIALNSAPTAAGLWADPAATTTMRNTILAGNSGGNLGGSLDTTGTNIVGGSIATLLDPDGLQDNGGPTKTIKLLSTAASAIGQADYSVCTLIEVTGIDQRGLSRQGTCDIGAVERDATKPTTTAPTIALRDGTNLSGSSMRAVVRWSGADTNGSGVERYQLQQRVNGGSFSTISSSLTGTSKSVTLANGSDYEYRVRAIDHDGNVGSYATAAVVKPRLVQNSSSAIDYNGSWTTASSSSYSGGSVRYATQGDNEWARYAFTGSSIAFVTTTGPSRGVVEISIDNTFVGRIDLYSSTTKYRQVVYARSWPSAASHSITITNYPPLGRKRADLDAFAVLK